MLSSLLMNSSKNETAQTLADPLQALTGLANLRDDPAAFEKFARRWPGFVHVGETEPPNGEARISVITPDTGDPFIRAYDFWDLIVRVPEFIPPRFVHMYKRREVLRLIWRGSIPRLLSALLIPGIPPEEKLLEKYTELPKTDAVGEPVLVPGIWAPITFDWQSGQITYKPQTEFQRALYELFRKSPLVKVCANRECPAPYFIAGKTSQRYCSDGCAEVFQREWKRRWWSEHGEKWRRNKSKKKRGKR